MILSRRNEEAKAFIPSPWGEGGFAIAKADEGDAMSAPLTLTLSQGRGDLNGVFIK